MRLNGFSWQHQIITLLGYQSPDWSRRPLLSNVYTISTLAWIIYQELYELLWTQRIEREGKWEKERERQRPKTKNQWVEAPKPKRAEQRGTLSRPWYWEREDLRPRRGCFIQEQYPRKFSLLSLNVTFRKYKASALDGPDLWFSRVIPLLLAGEGWKIKPTRPAGPVWKPRWTSKFPARCWLSGRTHRAPAHGGRRDGRPRSGRATHLHWANRTRCPRARVSRHAVAFCSAAEMSERDRRGTVSVFYEHRVQACIPRSPFPDSPKGEHLRSSFSMFKPCEYSPWKIERSSCYHYCPLKIYGWPLRLNTSPTKIKI